LEPYKPSKQAYESCWQIGEFPIDFELFETVFGPFKPKSPPKHLETPLNPSGAFETSQASLERFESIESIDRTPLNARTDP
jgi:hypothetical protein